MALLPPRAIFTIALAAFAPSLRAQAVHNRTSDTAATLASAPTSSSALAACQEQWLPTFGGAPRLVPNVDCMQGADLGDGPALYIGGMLWFAGGGLCSGIVRWNGRHWSDLAGGVGGVSHPEVFAVCAYDDGSGPALYVGGDFLTAGGNPAPYLARWDGQQWSAVGTGMNGPVRCMRVFDGGSGRALYIGGDFSTADGITANRIVRLDGAGFTALGGGANNSVRAFEVFDDGSGPALYLTGLFTIAGNQAAGHIARWTGSSWNPMGTGFSAWGYALGVHDDGTGRALYVGYSGTGPLGTAAPGIVKWDAAGWHALGGGFDGEVYCIRAYDDGTGTKLFAGGQHPSGAMGLQRWDGAQWTDVSSALAGDRCQVLELFDDGHGPSLFVGGYLGLLPPLAGTGIARMTGSTWSEVSDGGLDNGVHAVAALDDGTGAALYAGGEFRRAGALELNRIGRWNGSTWQPLGAGLDGTVTALAGFDDGSGWSLFAGGSFAGSGGVSMRGIARWTGSAWTPVGPGFNGAVLALCVHDDGSGPALYASGAFTLSGQTPLNHCARWDGSNWSAVGSGFTVGAISLVNFDDGAGSTLFAAVAGAILRWNGANWTTIGQSDGEAIALCGHDDGSGPALYVGGHFWSINGVPVTKVARWQGGVWSTTNYQAWFGEVDALASVATSAGPRLVAGGGFGSQGPGPGNGTAQWDGLNWSAMDSGVSSWYGPLSMTVYDDGSGPALYAGGRFSVCPDSRDSYLAKWGLPAGCWSPGVSICEPGSAGVITCPCANPPASGGRGCDNSAATGGASLAASGGARISADTLAFTASGEPPNAPSVLVQGTSLITSGVVFGQGVRCTAGLLKRMYVQAALGGTVAFPGPNDPNVSARSAALGDPIAQGQHRFYGVLYRDPQVLGGCSTTSTFNITQQIDVFWQP